MRTYNIAVLPGDGIGPEIMAQALKVMDAVTQKYGYVFHAKRGDVGGVAIDRFGHALPEATVNLCRGSDAILFGAIGGKKWEKMPPDQQPERAALLPLRKMFDLYANLRPVFLYDSLIDISSLRPEALEGGVDLMVVRELTGGIYFGKPRGREKDRAFDTLEYTRGEVERIAHTAFRVARKRRKKVTSIDKANVLASMVFWREIVNEVALQYPDVETSHMYVDNAAMQLIRRPAQFDVLLCGNMFGDILSDAASMIPGSLGMLPSASLSKSDFGMYEPCGGSAPDIAGEGIANPIAQILSLAMMCTHSLNLDRVGKAIEKAVQEILSQGIRTKDVATPGGKVVSTEEMGNRIAEAIA